VVKSFFACFLFKESRNWNSPAVIRFEKGEYMTLVIFFLAVFVVNCLIYAGCMVVGTRIAGGGGSFLHLLAIAAIGSFVGLLPIPYVSWILSIGVMLFLLNRWVGVDVMPEGVFILVVGGGLSFLARIFIISALAAAMGLA